MVGLHSRTEAGVDETGFKNEDGKAQHLLKQLNGHGERRSALFCFHPTFTTFL